MKNTIWMVLGVVAVVVVGGGLYFMNKSAAKKPAEKIITAPAAAKAENKPENITGSIKSLLTAGRALKCGFSNKTNDVTVEGTVYASGGKVREDFTSNAPNITMKGHVLVDGTTAYMWNDNSKQGFKFDLANMTPAPTGTNSQQPDINKNMNFSCNNWSADNSLLTIPSGISFGEFTVPGAPPDGQGSGTIQGGSAPRSACAACDNLPAGAAQDTCKSQLGCQ